MNLAERELDRLIRLGWHLPKTDEHGVRNMTQLESNEISFPEEAYANFDDESKSRDPWEVHRAEAISSLIRDSGLNYIWEIGAGDGSVSDILEGSGIEVICVEPIYNGARILANKGNISFCSTIHELKLPRDSIQAIGMFDVLEHISDPEETLAEIHRVLVPGGLFICTVPAYNFLFSDFDIAIGHYRRYTKTSLRKLFPSEKFSEQSSRYLFAILVLPALLLRTLPYKLGRRKNYVSIKEDKGNQIEILKKFSYLLTIWFQIEKKLKIPAGLSILGVWSKEGN